MAIHKEETLYSLNDLTIVPAAISNISSRSECGVFLDDGTLPLFNAPMSSVIDDKNYQIFMDNKINVIIPRNIEFKTRLELMTKTFVAVGLEELNILIDASKINIVNPDYVKQRKYICVDIANGHMKKLYDMCKVLKDAYGDNMVIMTGNIANVQTYSYICDHYEGVIDYIRLGIGGGSRCTTSSNGGIHYPIGSLIEECYTIKRMYTQCPYIVADGGFKNFDQIIKALALGADYVMLGNIFARTEEACGETNMTYLIEKWPEGKRYVDKYGKEYVRLRDYYGMSTKRAQKEFRSEKLKTAEGIEKPVPVSYTLPQWVDNFESYLKSAMSYTDFKDIYDFIGGPKLVPMTSSAFLSYFK